jgi:hypothetical protein
MATEGYPHHQTLRAWVDSAISCHLCALILYETRKVSNLGYLMGHSGARDAIMDGTFLQGRSLRLHCSRGSDVCRAMAVSASTFTLGPRGEVAAEQFHLVSVEVFTDEDDLATTYGTPWWRKLPQNTECEASIDMARSWLSECLHSHQREVVPHDGQERVFAACPTHVASTPYAAARLLQITPLHVSTVPGSEVTEPYATLSYSWGEGPQWPWGPHRIARQSLDAMVSQGLCRKMLPKTISDEVCVTGKLGLRFLWVDALCILQDDKDFLIESVKVVTAWTEQIIPKYYSHRRMMKSSDRLMAIAGLAKIISQQENSMRYFAGLWWDASLPSILMWYASPGNRRITPYVAPSWSWASLIGRVEFHDAWYLGGDAVSKCDVIDCWVVTSDKNDEFSRVLDAKLVLETTSLPGKAYQEGHKRCKDATLVLDGISELPGNRCYAILDDEREDDLEVQALLLKEDLAIERWEVLLVRPVEGESQEFMCVGIGIVSLETRLHSHRSFPDLERKRWTLV